MQERWNFRSVSGLMLSIFAMLPTGLTLLLFGALVGFSALGFAMGETQEGWSVGLIFTTFSILVGFGSAPMLALAGAILHPLGVLAAVYAIKNGATRSGMAMIPPHVVMLAVDLVVFLVYGDVLFSAVVESL